MLFKGRARKGLGEEVGDVLGSGNVLDVDFTEVDGLHKVFVSDVDVLCSLHAQWVFNDCNGSFVVAVHGFWRWLSSVRTMSSAEGYTASGWSRCLDAAVASLRDMPNWVVAMSSYTVLMKSFFCASGTCSQAIHA